MTLSSDETLRADQSDGLLFKNSFPMDWGRRFRAEAGKQFAASMLTEMRGGEVRTRRRADSTEAQHLASVETLLANLYAASVNVADPHRFVAVGFNRNIYVGTDLNADAMRQCRDYLEGQGLVLVGRGFRAYEHGGGDETWGRVTRMQATSMLRQCFERLQLNRQALTVPPSQLIRMNGAEGGAAPSCPDDIEASRELLETINHRLEAAAIGLDAVGEAMIKARSQPNEVDDADARATAEGDDAEEKLAKRRYAGDLTATSLYRIFSGDWASGGRIYGGWWMNADRLVRPHITIDGLPVVELDYKTLHPRLLYHREGRPLKFDPYTLPELPSDPVRELGKRTFNRLLNTRAKPGRNNLKLRAANGDAKVLPKGWTFASYLERFVERLAPIHTWLGTGVGIRLQREDSDLALAVLGRMEAAGVVALPIHDSFLVATQHRDLLWTAMHDAFRERYGHDAVIDEKHRKACLA